MYELHHQQRKVVVEGRKLNGQFGCLSFHPARFVEDPVKLTPAIKNKWSGGWTKNWFYCTTLLIPSPHGGKGTYTLQSYMNNLKFVANPPHGCAEDDRNDAVFVTATKTIGGRDAVEEYLTCDVQPLSQGWELGEAPLALTLKSKVEVPLPKFKPRGLSKKSNAVFVRLITVLAEKILGKYTWTEHCTCIDQIPNGGRLNRVFEELGVEYGARPIPEQPASRRNRVKKALRKRKGGKADALVPSPKERRASKRVKPSKVPEKRQTRIPKDQPSVKELLLVKPL